MGGSRRVKKKGLKVTAKGRDGQTGNPKQGGKATRKGKNTNARKTKGGERLEGQSGTAEKKYRVRTRGALGGS